MVDVDLRQEKLPTLVHKGSDRKLRCSDLNAFELKLNDGYAYVVYLFPHVNISCVSF